MTPVTIPLNKGRLFLFLLLSLGFVTGGIWLWNLADGYSGFKHWKALLGAVLCIPFFGLGVVVFAYKLFDTRPGLILNDEGVHRLGLFGFQPVIPWAHITHCSIIKVKRTSILLIHVDNVEEVLERLPPLARWSQRVAVGQYGTPHSLASSNLKISIEDLKDLIEKGAAAYRDKS